MHKQNKNSNMPAILIAMPAYNEVRYIDDILTAVLKFSENILVIDDGSDDGTSDNLKKYPNIITLSHKTNEGYGQCLIDAFGYACKNKYEWLITLDCDHQHEPSYIPHFYSEIKKNNVDIISGSRYLKKLDLKSKTPPPERIFINKKITNILNQNLKLSLTDAFCGFKAYRTTTVNQLKLTEKGYGLPLQLWILASKAGLRVSEMSVPLIYHDPKRNFCGSLENPHIRLRYYIDIIEKELGCSIDKDIEKYQSSSGERFYICQS
ncbi:MAG: glycosyltransferase family 2 protein [Sedimentisphaerales bacterium]|nr:glycosyltransferase family 2 protein [Sedimentisphaerales bacterium]